MSAVEQELIRAHNDPGIRSQDLFDYPELLGRHQVGGEPPLIQEPRRFLCPLCESKMAFVAAIADENGTERGFTDNWGIQMLFYLCQRCSVVLAIDECD